MEHKNMKRSFLSGLFWKYAEKSGVQGVSFVVQIILARLLTPADYVIAVFIAIGNVFVQSGFASALIQKLHVEKEDYSSVFVISTLVSVACYLLLFFSAPLIAAFYKQEMLVSVLRVQTTVLLISPIINIQNAILSRNMQFKKSFLRNFGAVVISGTAGILMAVLGYGVWALVWSNIVKSVAGAIILWITVGWRPSLKLCPDKAKILFAYGWKLLLSSLLDTVYNNLYTLIIGKLFSADMLGYYNRGRTIPAYVVDNVDGAIQGVLFPAVSNIQTDLKAVRNVVSRSIKTSAFLLFPAMAGLAAAAKPLTVILLTEKWLPSVPFLQLSCAAFAFYCIHTTNLQAISAMGRSDIFLKLEIIKKVSGVLVLAATLPFGVYVMVAGNAFFGLVSTVINAYPNKKLIGYGFAEQWKDILPALILALIMGAAVWSLNLLGLGVWLTLIAQITLGVLIYFSGAVLFRMESGAYLFYTVRQLRNRTKSAGPDTQG
jgi:O-antigen/teichoic acid export membrane protein